jgi:uncharacterized membrane protein YvbJ
MSCIDEQLLQEYIDGECSVNEAKRIEQHLSACSECARQHGTMKRLAKEIKLAMNDLNRDQIEIPAFIPSLKKSTPKPIKYIIYSLSAACIILFILFFVDKKYHSNQKETIIVQCITRDVDANRPATKQEFVIEVLDDKGKSSEYFIE